MKKDIVHEIEPTSSSTLVKNRRPVLREPVRQVSVLCSIYDVNFSDLAEEPNFGVGQDLSGHLYFVLAVRPYKV